MSSFKIDPRDELRVFVNQHGGITLLQVSGMGEEDIVAINRDQVETVIGFLQKCAEAIDSGDYEKEAEGEVSEGSEGDQNDGAPSQG